MPLISCASLGTSLCLALRAAIAVQIGNPADLSRSGRFWQTGHPWPGCQMARVLDDLFPTPATSHVPVLVRATLSGNSSLYCDARRGKGGGILLISWLNKKTEFVDPLTGLKEISG